LIFRLKFVQLFQRLDRLVRLALGRKQGRELGVQRRVVRIACYLLGLEWFRV
jgi:hypothetical protein